MQGLAAVLFPAVLMLFVLAMEKVQTRIDQSTEIVSDEHVDDLLSAEPQAVIYTEPPLPTTIDDLRSRRAS